jgi:hypothetical protein
MELQQMRLELQAMMNQLLKVIPTSTLTLRQPAQPQVNAHQRMLMETTFHQDKRINNQSTPAKKKLVFD